MRLGNGGREHRCEKRGRISAAIGRRRLLIPAAPQPIKAGLFGTRDYDSALRLKAAGTKGTGDESPPPPVQTWSCSTRHTKTVAERGGERELVAADQIEHPLHLIPEVAPPFELAQTATTEPFGTGCSSSAGIPLLAAAPGSLPLLNDTFTVQMTSLPTLALHQTFGIVGLSKTIWAGFTLPQDLGFIGIPGCTQYVSVDASVLLPPDTGTATWDIPIPNDQSLNGLVFYLQGVVQDFEPLTSGGAIQWSVTNALEGVIR